ncbi:MAG: uroporphyrinogen-III C-methyltransferase [Polyangiaceae bacterium]
MSEIGKVWLVGAGPGDPSLITVRGRELLSRATVVLYDALAHPALLEECQSSARLISVGKRLGCHTVPQSEIIKMMIDFAHRGELVVRLKGGDPYLFARGAEEAEALVEAGVPFGVVPGISSPVGTSTYAGFSLTHRDLSSSVTFVTGTDKHGEHWSEKAWARIATASDTLCILMGMRRIEEITSALIDGGRSGETPAAVIEWGARPEQRVLVATLGTLAERVRVKGLRNPSVIVVGDVVSLREQLRWYDSDPLFGKRLLLPRPEHQARATARAIRSRGAEAALVPLIAIEDPPDKEAVARAARELTTYDWVLLTSANGAERLVMELQRQGRDARAFGTSRVGVIGPKTAEPLLKFGIRPDLVADEHVAEGLLRGLLDAGPIRRALLFRAAEAREVLPDTLRERGVTVDVVAGYRTRCLAAESGSLLRAYLTETGMDAVLVTSSSMARSLVDALGADAASLLERTRVASIGPITTATLVELGVKVHVTASKYTIDGLLEALSEDFAARAFQKSC